MRKWLILASYSASSFLSGAAWATLIPIPSVGMSYFGITDWELTLYSYSFFLACVPLSLPSNWMVARSLHFSLHLIWATSLVGCWVRVLAGRNFWISFAGQLVLASGCMLMLTACSTTASIWFPSKQALMATSVGASANFVGIGFSYLLMSLWPDIRLALWGQALFASFFWVFNFSIIKSDPIQVDRNFQRFKDDWMICLKNKDLMILASLSACGLATNYAIASVIGFLLIQQGFSTAESGIVGFIYAISGLLGGLAASFVAEGQGQVKKILFFILISAITSSAIFSALIKFKFASFVLAAVFGASITGSLPLCIRICIESEKRINESIPTNLIYFIAQVFSCVFVYPIQFWQDWTGLTGMWAGCVLIVCSFSMIIFLLKKRNDVKNDSELFQVLRKE
jgi:hypothetical protein